MSDFNPFAVPDVNSFANDAVAIEYRETLKKFRQQIQALGALWILFGLLLLAAFGFLLSAGSGRLPAQLDGPVIAVIGGSSAIYLFLGVSTCFKQIWAVYAGLVLTYIGLAAQLIQINICGLVISAVILLQAHRVIGFAKQLKAAGIALNTAP